MNYKPLNFKRPCALRTPVARLPKHLKTQADFVEYAKGSVKIAIYPASQATGYFVEAIWLFTIERDEESPKILGTAVELKGTYDWKTSGAFARRAVSTYPATFAVIAVQSISASSTEEAIERLGKKVKRTSATQYAFYATAPGFEPVLLTQHFHRDKNNAVKLDGKLEVVSGEEVVMHTEALNGDLNPFAEYTAEDIEITEKLGMVPVVPGIFTDKRLKISTMFPKGVQLS